MFRRLSLSLLLAGSASLAALSPKVAFAAPKDAAALKLDDAAINGDYLATKFPDAEKKLKQALTLCGASNCTPKTLAQLHCDLGVVYFVGSRKTEEAKAQFTEALKADPTAAIAKELSTSEVEQLFAVAKGGGAPPPAAPVEPPPVAPPPAASSDEISHVPATEQAVMTAVPVYAELPDGMTPAKVELRYKAFGAPEWKTLDLKKLKTGYGGEVPCVDIGTTPGDLKYYIEAVDTKGDVIGTSGTRNAPHKVPIKAEIAGEPPHLPGAPPPAQCQGGGPIDCPPGLPGCSDKKKKGDKALGATCDDDSECESGACSDTLCATPGGSAGPVQPKKNWISISVQQDALLLPSTKEVCRDGSTYSCFDADDAYYVPGQAKTGIGQADEIAGGPSFATTRFLIGYDRVVGNSFTVGAKAGYSIGGAVAKPGGAAFLPVHFEARAAYFIPLTSAAPFTTAGPRLYVVAAGGVAQVDSKVVVKVYEGRTPINLAAWKTAGQGFAALGGGFSYAVTVGSAVYLEVKAMQLFGESGTGGNVQLGFSQGF